MLQKLVAASFSRLLGKIYHWFQPKCPPATLEQVLKLDRTLAEYARWNVDLRLARFPLDAVEGLGVPLESLRRILTFSLTLQSQDQDLPRILPFFFMRDSKNFIRLSLRVGLERETCRELVGSAGNLRNADFYIGINRLRQILKWKMKKRWLLRSLGENRIPKVAADVIWVRGRESRSLAEPILKKLSLTPESVLILSKRKSADLSMVLLPEITLDPVRTRALIELSKRPDMASAIKARPDIWNHLVNILETWSSLERRIDFQKTKWIVGAFDKTTIGPLLSELSRGSKTSIVNYQHGLVSNFKVLDNVSFDHFLSWNEISKEVFIQEGYKGAISVVGNPTWNGLAELGRKRVIPPMPTLGLFMQVAKGYFSTLDSQKFFIETVSEALRHNKAWKVRVRRHPSQNHELHNELLQSFPERVELSTPQESFEDFLSSITAALSVSSTAVVDAAAYGLPAAIVARQDFSGLLDLGFQGSVQKLHDSNDLATFLNRCLSSPVPSVTQERFRDPDYVSRVTGMDFVEKM